MPSNAASKVGKSPQQILQTPPTTTTQSPPKSRRSRDGVSKLSQSLSVDEPEFSFLSDDLPLNLDPPPRRLDDIELQEKDGTVFLTEANVHELGAIDEEDFEDEEIKLARESNTLDELDRGRDSDNSEDSRISSLTGSDDQDVDYDTDLEVEPDKWLHPELFDRDTTGVNRYMRMCQKLEIQPITYFVKHMQDSELIMKYHGLGPLGVKAMSDPLEINNTIEKMDLEGNYIFGVGAIHLSKVLKDNVYVSELTLSENRLGNDGAKAICELLVENKTITYLDLKGNHIEDGAANSLYDMLSKNTDLKTLILRHNKFEDDGASLLKQALVDNDTLTSIDLSWNHFQWRGCCAIAEGLQENQGLKIVNVCMNGFGLEGSKALEETLRHNHTMTDLDVSYCRIPLTGAPHIAAGIRHNDALESINIGFNALQNEGGYVILVGVDANEEGCLRRIDFGNLTVKKDFKTLADSLEEERPMTVLYGGLMPDVTSFRNVNYDPWAAHVHDPMTKLKEWLEKTGYRLVDLLLTFDRDNTLSIDITELKAGIRNAGIQMTDAEIEILMRNLDDDNSGEIDMKELMAGHEQHTLATREAIRYKEEQDHAVAERRKSMKNGDAKAFQRIIEDSDPVKPIAMV